MYLTATQILDNLDKTKVLDKLIDQFSDYQLVITGHSLGAGVASVVALLLKPKPKYSHLVCYAFSPPGCVLRFVSSRCFLLYAGKRGGEKEGVGGRENICQLCTMSCTIIHCTCIYTIIPVHATLLLHKHFSFR